MRKDSLILLLVLTVFALMGADCRAPWEDDDVKDRPLPDRAFASSPLLRAYYDTRTIPEEMRDLKIPEGTTYDKDELTIQFQMGGSATVDEVRTHLYIMPPKGKDMGDVDLICRCVAPDGTASSWKGVNLVLASDAENLQAEVGFLFEFDGMNSDGNWRIQIKDYLDDKDGRCVMRNASLHINRGEAAGLGGSPTETQTISAAAGNYGIVPEARGERFKMDIGWFGAKRMLRNEFTFTSSFFVRQAVLELSVYEPTNASGATESWFVLVAPSGNWHIGLLTNEEIIETVPEVATGLDLLTFQFVIDSTPTGLMSNLNGEPSAGTWTIYMVDTLKDNQYSTLTTDRADTAGGAPVPNTGVVSLQLTGVS
ncbi:MAG: hypothetical protein KDB90_09900 [Planctomycetes bacterium]|nr:hypothetical protein [Planctomycetota bacterium]